uniref:SIZ1 n=1 Tax=Arundo donax TaxID=35708 RepID=A0A0A9EXS6_ARUDO
MSKVNAIMGGEGKML